MNSLVILLISMWLLYFFPPVRMVLTVGFSYITFIMLSMYPPVLHSLKFLSLKYVEFGQRLLLHLLKWSFDFAPSVHLFLNLWDKAHLIMVDNIFLYVCICFMCIKEFSTSLFVLLDQNVALINCCSFMLISHANHNDHELVLWNHKLSSN